MRDIIHKAIIGSRDVLDGVVDDFAKNNQLTEDEMLSRFVGLHRGNPRAMAKFVSENAPVGADRMKAWRDYESKMEQQLTARGAQMTVPGYMNLQRRKQ